MINFSLTDLRYLLALAEEQHFARAANKVFVSQPTLSIAIKKLEENLGVVIFERMNNQIVTTPSGVKIIEQAYHIIHESENLLKIAAAQKDIYTQPLKIGAILTIGPYLFPQLVAQIIQQIPQLKLVVEENYTANLLEKLLNGELDVLILATPVEHKDLEQITIGIDPLNVICARNHKLAKKVQISQQQLQEETFLLLGEGHCFRDQVVQVCPSCNTSNNQFASLITTSSLETIKYMVAMNLGVSILPKLAQHNLPENIVAKKISKPEPYREISLVMRRNFARKELVTSIKEILISLLTTNN